MQKLITQEISLPIEYDKEVKEILEDGYKLITVYTKDNRFYGIFSIEIFPVYDKNNEIYFWQTEEDIKNIENIV